MFYPTVQWAQSKDFVFVTVVVTDAKDVSVTINDSSLQVSGKRGLDSADFSFSYDLYTDIDHSASKYKVGARGVEAALSKKEAGNWWPRLTKEKDRTGHIKADWDKWVDEDEADGPAFNQDDFMKGMGGFGGQGMGGMPGMPGMGGMGGMGGLEGMMGGMPGMGGMDFSQFAGGDDEDDEDDDEEDDQGHDAKLKDLDQDEAPSKQ
eukprot:ANDGO_00793.mRNA.1 Protein wos2